MIRARNLLGSNKEEEVDGRGSDPPGRKGVEPVEAEHVELRVQLAPGFMGKEFQFETFWQ